MVKAESIVLGSCLQEAYILHTFPEDFYDREMRLIVCAYLRPQTDFKSMGIWCYHLAPTLSPVRCSV